MLSAVDLENETTTAVVLKRNITQSTSRNTDASDNADDDAFAVVIEQMDNWIDSNQSPELSHSHSSSPPSELQDSMYRHSILAKLEQLNGDASIPSQHSRRSSRSSFTSVDSKSSTSTVEKLMDARRRQAEIVEIPAIRMGYMFKQCRVLKTSWTKRFFILDRGILTNYHTDMDNMDENKVAERATKQIHLHDYMLITDSNKNLLILEAYNRTTFTRQNLTLYLPDRRDYRAWELEMNRHAKYTSDVIRHSLRSVVTANSQSLSFSCNSSNTYSDLRRILPSLLLNDTQSDGGNNNINSDDNMMKDHSNASDTKETSRETSSSSY